MQKVELANGDFSLNFNPYKKPVFSTRNGSIFQVHPYPTKINYKSIVPFILAHTKPGDIVFDCFAGTCSTGLAAASCSKKNEAVLKGLGEEAVKNAKWGSRTAVCIDIGRLPTFVGSTVFKPVDTIKLDKLFNEWMANVESEWGWLYRVKDPQGREGAISYIYSSDIIRCKNCKSENAYIELFVDFQKGFFKDTAKCPKCKHLLNAKNLEPVLEKVHDSLLKTDLLRIKRVPYIVFGKTQNKRWKREASAQDLKEIKKIEKVQLPDSMKPIPMMGKDGVKKWGEMYRAGYHKGVSHVHHFYSPRNLLAISVLFHEARKIPTKYRAAIQLAISSYNVANSTLMTRFVFKEGNKNPVNTSAQPGALYIPHCQVEKNVFVGVRRKFNTILRAINEISKWNPDVDVRSLPAQNNRIKTNSIDYIFTDPPFGENIQYSELNFLSEAWMGFFTRHRYETIISKHQNKSVDDYESLLTLAFRENYRVLKPGKFMTVVFHNTRKAVWNALRRAILQSGFRIIDTSILDKTQKSFKQTTTRGAVRKDPIILAWKPRSINTYSKCLGAVEANDFIVKTLSKSEDKKSLETTFDYLFGRFIGSTLSSGEEMPVDAKEFKKILTNLAYEKDNYWYLK